jgi:hypothetical protein
MTDAEGTEVRTHVVELHHLIFACNALSYSQKICLRERSVSVRILTGEDESSSVNIT